MGATFFMLLLFLLMGISVFSFILSVSSLIRSVRSKQARMRNRGLAFLAVSIFAATFPLASLLMLRSGNLQNSNRCESDILIEGGYQDTHFALSGKDYYVLPFTGTAKLPCGEAVASWSDDQTFLDYLFGRRSCGNYYRVLNENDYDLLSTGAFTLFCSTEDFQATQTWYGDPGIYEWFIRLPGEEGLVFPVASVDPAIHSALLTLEDSYDKGGSDIMAVTITEQLEQYDLFSQSRDHVVQGDFFSFYQYEEEFYICNASSIMKEYRTYYLQPLPEEINTFLRSIFTN